MEISRYWVKGADQRDYGPVDAGVVRQWLEQGRLTAGSWVRREDSAQWQALGSVPELVGVMVPPPVIAVVGPAQAPEGGVQRGGRISGLAVGSLVAGILAPCTLGLSGLVGLVLGVVALVRIQRSPGELRGKGFAIGGICISVVVGMVVMLLLFGVGLPNYIKARESRQRNECLNHLRQIDAAKEQWFRENRKRDSDAPTWEDLVGPGKYFREKPVCPAGGTYTIGDMMTEPTCTVPTHTLQYPMTRRPPR